MRYSMASMVLGLAFAMSACSDSTSPSTTGASLDAVSPTPGPRASTCHCHDDAVQCRDADLDDAVRRSSPGHDRRLRRTDDLLLVERRDDARLPAQSAAAAGRDVRTSPGGGMTDAAGQHVDVEQHGMAMGGTPVTGDMTGGMHDGQSTSMMAAAAFIAPSTHHPGYGVHLHDSVRCHADVTRRGEPDARHHGGRSEWNDYHDVQRCHARRPR